MNLHASIIEEAERSVTTGFISPEQTLPLVITANDKDIDLVEWAEKNKSYIKANKEKYGAVLFRGFEINSAEKFEQVIKATSSQAIEYMERSSPRDSVSGNIYTSTSQPKESEIFLHTEQSFNLTFPLHIYFNCHIAAESGGCTPLADTRKIFNRIPQQMRDKLIAKSYLYQRNFMKYMYVSWENCYQTQDKQEVEKYCDNNQIDFAWGDNDITLTTKQVRPMVSNHPGTNENCWFNHCTFFNFATLDPKVQQFLSRSYSEQEYPNHTFYGDGTSLEPEVIETLIKAYEAEKTTFDWLAGDVLMVDNMMVAHGRESFEGERRVLTGMSEPHRLSDVQFTA